jgi:hypothetical protein
MGLIRTHQLDYLNKSNEQISFKVFDSDGVYVETLDEDILITAPEQLVPLDRSLVKNYERPLKDTIFTSKFIGLNFTNQNAQFFYGEDGWILGPHVDDALYTKKITDNLLYEPVKPLSGSSYFKGHGTGTPKQTLLIKSDINDSVLRQGVSVQVSFSYNMYDISNGTNRYVMPIYAVIDSTGNGSPDYMYDFEENKWIAYAADSASNPQKQFNIINTLHNKWVGFSKEIQPFEVDSVTTDVNIEIGILEPQGLSLGTVIYLDNFGISEKLELNISNIKNIRSRYSYDGGYTAVYETQNIFSNELKDDDSFVGQIEGDYERPRDSSTKTLEALVTQEITNDNRDYLTKYEGVFRNKDTKNIGLHNKVWVNFGVDVLQEPASCYLDAMVFDVKAAEYDIKMHIPNQDDDAPSIYKSIAE